jgi:hypothetical protein
MFNANGNLLADHNFTGTHTYKFAGSRAAYTVDGMTTVTDNRVSGVMTVMTGMGVTRTEGCCRPTGGTLTTVRTGGAFPGTRTWVFSSTCGTAKLNGNNVTLPACI